MEGGGGDRRLVTLAVPRELHKTLKELALQYGDELERRYGRATLINLIRFLVEECHGKK